MTRRARIDAPGSLHHIICRGIERRQILRIFDIPEALIKSSGKEPEGVKARSVAAYWAVRGLGMAGTEVGKELRLTQSAISRAVQSEEKLVRELGLSILDKENA